MEDDSKELEDIFLTVWYEGKEGKKTKTKTKYLFGMKVEKKWEEKKNTTISYYFKGDRIKGYNYIR